MSDDIWYPCHNCVTDVKGTDILYICKSCFTRICDERDTARIRLEAMEKTT